MEITTGGIEPKQILERGQSPSGCSDKTSKGRLPLLGQWLALTPKAIQNANPFVIANAVKSSKSDERFFFTGIPLKVGPIQNFTVNHRLSGTTA